MSKKPSTNGINGRNKKGQFAKGNPGGPGNPHAKKVAELRAALMDAVTKEDITVIAEKMIEKARRGDLHMIRELFDRLFGKAPQDLNLGNQDDKPLEVNIGGNLTEEEIRRIAEAVSAGSGAVK